jgi:uncharacterized protein (DUF885 family)
MKNTLIVFLLLLIVTIQLQAQETINFKIDALTKNANALKEKERMKLLSEIYFDYWLQTYPEYGTYMGKPTDNSRWTDLSLAAIEQRKKDRLVFLNALQSINVSNLDAADKLNYNLLKTEIDMAKEGDKFQLELLQFEQMSGYHQQFMQVAGVTTFSKKKDVDDFFARLDKIPAVVDQFIVLMGEGLKKGITPPRITVAGVPEQIQNMLSDDPSKSPLLKNLNDYLAKQPREQQESISAAAVKIISEKVNPTLVKLKTYIEKTYIPGTRESIALTSLPDGENWYNYMIKTHTTTSLTYKQIHEIGLSEVKRIRAAMDSVYKATGYKGTFNEFLNFLRTDPQFFYDTPTQLLDGYRVIAKKLDGELPKFFGKLPRLPYTVIPVPAYDEKFRTTAYYLAGSAEAGRAGGFYANTYDLKSRPKWEMEALTIHEAVPGHHLQLALSMEMENVPEFRKYSSYTAFIEGWGLYSESLGTEMGFYKDPYSKFGQLTYEMWRAIRLVVDTGMHGMGWTRQQAIDYFKANTAKTEHDIKVEVDRYIAWPGQALAYKIGELKIKELRARATKKLGDKFDIRKFHDVVLANGAMPLNVLEQKVNEWMDTIK